MPSWKGLGFRCRKFGGSTHNAVDLSQLVGPFAVAAFGFTRKFATWPGAVCSPGDFGQTTPEKPLALIQGFRPAVVIEVSQSPAGIIFAVQEGGDKNCVWCSSGKGDHHYPQGKRRIIFGGIFSEAIFWVERP